MSTDRPDITSGDPLGGGGGDGGARRLPGPEAPVAGYGAGPVPPGAFRPPPAGPVAPGRPGAQPLVLAEWWRRAVALVIDGIIVGVISLVLIAAFGGVFSLGFLGGDELGVVSLVLGLLAGGLAVFVAAVLYAPLIMARTDGQTLGKMATSCRVVRVDGGRVDFGWALLREGLVKGLGLAIVGGITGGIAYLVDFLWPLWDDENRTLHDMVVRSRVVRA
jgi:uncharacterized RDD family membrane protein YckC